MQPWIEIGKKLINTKEIKGSQHNATIVQMWKDIKRGGIKDDETPWCAAMVGSCLEQAGIRSTRFESAKSYLDWGYAIHKPVLGCVVVYDRVGGGHVGFCLGQDSAGNLQILGGNQDDQVKVSTFKKDRPAKYRWHTAFGELPEVLPTLTAAEASKSEA